MGSKFKCKFKLLEINNGIAIELVEGPVVNSLIKKGINLSLLL